jgi:RNase P/RNase MRP subunit POP5
MLETLRDSLGKRKYPCAVKTFYDTLSEADQEILMSVLSDYSLSHSSIEKALKEQAGVTLADTTIARHRSGRCSCSRI